MNVFESILWLKASVELQTRSNFGLVKEDYRPLKNQLDLLSSNRS